MCQLIRCILKNTSEHLLTAGKLTAINEKCALIFNYGHWSTMLLIKQIKLYYGTNAMENNRKVQCQRKSKTTVTAVALQCLVKADFRKDRIKS